MIVTVSGVPGAGDTVTSRTLGKKTNYRVITIGEMYKQIARKQGFARRDLNKFWKTKDGRGRKMHHELDAMQKKIVKKERNLIINGRLAAFNAPRADLKIFLTAPLDIRAKRIAKRDKMPFKKAKERTKKREKIERETWKRMYGVDYAKDLDMYDAVLNTEKWNVQQVVSIIQEMMKSKKR